MKEKDLEKAIDNLIIKGLIREAEQDNAEFEAALREMSEEDFLALISDTATDPANIELRNSQLDNMVLTEADEIFDNLGYEDLIEESATFSNTHMRANSKPYYSRKIVSNEYSPCELDEEDSSISYSRRPMSYLKLKRWIPWATAIMSAAAILLIILIPVYRSMDSKICESVLLANESYISPSRGADMSTMQKDEVRSILHELERQYSISKQHDADLLNSEKIDSENTDYYLENESPQETGMNLVQAYLKLRQKDKAVKVLKELAGSDTDPEFKEYCQKLIEILE
ncbi:MAG: hypothetical protein K2G85_11195 [Muribaculaceae bacterium]|nr:hypothetical protein [Muribaculaceae bacterium]